MYIHEVSFSVLLFFLKEPPDATEICTNNEPKLWAHGSKNCSMSLTAPFPRFLTRLGI